MKKPARWEMIVWKHHLASDFKSGTPVDGNGVGAGGTVFTDFDKMILWLGKEAENFFVAPIEMTKEELEFNFLEPFLATSKVVKSSLSPFASIEDQRTRVPERREDG